MTFPRTVRQDMVVLLRTHKSQYHKISSGSISCCPLQLHGQPYPVLLIPSPPEQRLFSSHTSTPHWLSEDNSHRHRCGSVCLECLFTFPFSISALIPHSPFQDVSLSLPSALTVPRGSQWESIATIS